MGAFTGKVAAITGAASGIGRALAVALAQRGCLLALADIDSAGLQLTVERCQAAAGRPVTSCVVDVGNRDAMHAWARSVAEHHGKVNLIFNNAGIAQGSSIQEMSYEDIDRVMSVNFWGVVHGTLAFLPYLRNSGDGHVVNISSIFGMLAMPGQSAYNASKFAVRGFSEALRMELDISDNGVTASTVLPGGIRTAIADKALIRSDFLIPDGETTRRLFAARLVTEADRAAEIILDGVEQRKRRILIGRDAYWFDRMARTLPSLYQRLLGGIIGRKLSQTRLGAVATHKPS